MAIQFGYLASMQAVVSERFHSFGARRVMGAGLLANGLNPWELEQDSSPWGVRHAVPTYRYHGRPCGIG
jgi:hypothetical protein